MASKSELRAKPARDFKKPKLDSTSESDSSKTQSNQQRVILNPADCDLDFDIEENGIKGSGLYEEGFAYCWSGARAKVGITGGKYCFGCKIISAQPVNMEDTPLNQQHVCRVGISRGDDAVRNLGETPHSFGFGGTGKFSMAGKFSDYGDKFGVGDTIVCAVDLESKPLASVGFAKNGRWLGVAKQFDAGSRGLGVVDSTAKKLQWESALFPHVLLKNVVVQMQFCVDEGLVPEEGYKPWPSALADGNAVVGPNFSNTRDCELMMMVGLPASGKTTWAEKWVETHPEKRYVLLGTNLILDQMKVHGLLRKHNYGERFERLMGRANAIFDTLLSRAARTPRNYIIDQTNVFKSARNRKLRPFANFHKIATIVFPKPEELKFRADKRFKEMGKEVPADAVNNMLANYVLPMSKDMPGSDEFFDQVNFVELDREESLRYLEEMKCALRTDSTPSMETCINSCTGPSLQNQGGLSVGGRHWQSSHPPSPLHLGHQIAHQMNSAYQGVGSSSGPYQSYQSPAPGAPVLYGYENFVPRNNSAYSGGYDAIPGGRTDPHPSYGAVDPFGRSNTVGNITILSDPCKRNTVEPSSLRTVRTSSNTYNSTGGPNASLQTPRAPPYLLSPSPSSYGRPYGTPSLSPALHPPPPLPAFQSPSPSAPLPLSRSPSPYPPPRLPGRNFPSGVDHAGGYNRPHPRYY